MILTYLLLLSALIEHLFMDFHKAQHQKPIVHWISAGLVLVVSVAAGFLNQWLTHVSWWQFVIYSLSIHLALFDPIWNEINGNDLFYAGTPNNPDRAWTDRLWQYVPPMGQILFRLWFLLFGAGWYYHLDLIVR